MKIAYAVAKLSVMMEVVRLCTMNLYSNKKGREERWFIVILLFCPA